ncbi:hypothetical protein A6A06_03250 [Streptomyces sp. CB02923]|uniref:ATP-grasp domain-containing protein n=1 Tax=Streptomyces sp. CB02923 TaxID=1718985 RepID=UPI00093BB815|nr:ATP-grasp domain-containing protein [Streptomyces sp. CB02923]OKI09692.1 hypothetical protein A6A06_03250 [Streptomyces sp. CB02923]
MAIVFLEANNTGTTSDAIRQAQERGYDTVFVTMQQDFYEGLADNPLELCSNVITCDTYNVAEILRAVRSVDVEAVISFDDYHLVVAALCAMALGLPHADVRGLTAARYKDVARERTRELRGGIWSRVIAEDTVDQADLDTFPYPVIAKPVDESSSVSVRLCHGPADALAVMKDYRAHTVNVRGYRPTRAMLFEEYVEGDEYSCELFWDGADGWRVAGVTQKALGAPPHFVECGHVFPAPLTAELRTEVERQALSWVRAVGLRCGAAHVELRIKEGTAHLIEINPRLPGGHITQLVQWCTGIDLVGRYLDFHLGAGTPAPDPAPEFAAACSRFLLPDEVPASWTSQDLSAVLERLPSFRRGRVPQFTRASDGHARTNYDRVGYALLAASGPDGITDDLDQLARQLRN